MIAKIKGYGGTFVYVALRYSFDHGKWLPVRDSHGRLGEMSQIAAARLCVGALQDQLDSVIAQASKLHRYCKSSDELEPSLQPVNLSLELCNELDIVAHGLHCLLTPPTLQDRAFLPMDFERSEPETADQAFLSSIKGSAKYAKITTGKKVTRQGIAAAQGFLNDLLANFDTLARSNDYLDKDGGNHDNGGDA